MRLCHLAALSVLLGFGCGNDPADVELEGSLDSIYALAHSETRAQQSDTTMSVEFRNRDGSVVTLTFDISDVDAAGTFSMPTPVAASFPQYDNPNFDLKVTTGQVTIERFPAGPGDPITGTFEASVEKASLVEEESGRRTYSVRGSFDTPLMEP